MAKKNDVHLVVVKYFIRVMKNHDMYRKFTKSFDRVVKSDNDSNPFGNFENVYQMSVGLNNFTNRDLHSHSRGNTEYERITMMINHLLHFFLENCGVHPKFLGKYGQEIFDLSCFKLFGNKYLEDMEKIDKGSDIPQNPRTEKEAWLISVYINKSQRGEFTGSYSDFKEYVCHVKGNKSYEEIIGLNDDDDMIMDEYDNEIFR